LSVAEAPQQGVRTANVTESHPLQQSANLAPRVVRVSSPGLAAGDIVAFVLAARSPDAAPFGLLLQPGPDGSRASEVNATARDALAGRAPATLQPVGFGAGFRIALYSLANIAFATNLAGPPVVMHEEIASPEVLVEDRQRQPFEPFSSVRDTTLSAGFPSGGYTEFAVSYVVAGVVPCPMAGTFSIQLELHGTTLEHTGELLPEPYGLALGSATAAAFAEGPGPSAGRMEFAIAHACQFELLVFRQLDLGVTVEDLVGVPLAPSWVADSGLIGDFPMPSWLPEDITGR
jgi:hypothetical protein